MSFPELALDLAGYGKAEAATQTDLEQVIAQFSQLAKSARFGGVEVHATRESVASVFVIANKLNSAGFQKAAFAIKIVFK